MDVYELNWKRLDPEARWGFRARKFTAVNNLVALLWGGIFTAVFYGTLYPLHLIGKWQMVDMFFHGGEEKRSMIPYFTIFLSCWCLAFLILKWKKLKVQRLALNIRLVPDSKDYVISPMNAQNIILELNKKVFRGADFMALWRVECALANLRNIGRVSDVSSILSDLAKNDANYVESSYILPHGLIWAIPVLGFIGTVLGLSQAVGGFGAVVSGGADLEALKGALGGVTGGLATAFETTLIALVAALIIQLLMTVLLQKEEDFLDQCTSYCHQNLTLKLKMLDLRDEIEENMGKKFLGHEAE